MSRKLAALVLVSLALAPVRLAGQRVDPRLPARYRGLVDSLNATVGAAPESLIYARPEQEGRGGGGLAVLGDFNVRTRVMTLSPTATRPRHWLAHEYGHLLQFTDQVLFFDWLDAAGGKEADRAALERFAEEFADAFESLTDAPCGCDLRAAVRSRLAPPQPSSVSSSPR